MVFLNYPYFVGSFILLAIAMAGLGLMKAHRKALLMSGILSVPCSLTSFYFVPEYWQPVRLLDFPLCIEDALFSFSTGIIVWILVGFFYNESAFETGLKNVLKRYAMVVSIGIVVMLVHRQLPVMVMTQAMIGIFFLGTVFSIKRWEVLPIAFLTGIAFAVLYSLFLAGLFAVFPGFYHQWSHPNLSGFFIMGIPVEESAWAFMFGTCWVIIMTFIFNAMYSASVQNHKTH